MHHGQPYSRFFLAHFGRIVIVVNLQQRQTSLCACFLSAPVLSAGSWKNTLVRTRWLRTLLLSWKTTAMTL